MACSRLIVYRSPEPPPCSRVTKKWRLEEESVEGMLGADEPGVYSGPKLVGKLVARLNTERIPENVVENNATK